MCNEENMKNKNHPFPVDKTRAKRLKKWVKRMRSLGVSDKEISQIGRLSDIELVARWQEEGCDIKRCAFWKRAQEIKKSLQIMKMVKQEAMQMTLSLPLNTVMTPISEFETDNHSDFLECSFAKNIDVLKTLPPEPEYVDNILDIENQID
jgi:hypothetical protein